MTAGLLLFAHGARDPRWALPFEDIAKRVRQRQPGRLVVLAFLEFMTPDLATAGDQMVREGCTDVRVLPLFLGAGGHVRKDVPALMAQLAERHPQVRWSLHTAIGELDAVVEAMAVEASRLFDAPSPPVPTSPSPATP